MTFGPEDFRQKTDVSRETLDRLRHYVRLLLDWNDRLNLIGASTIPDLWRRHIWDSAQVLNLVPGWRNASPPLCWLDIGSGAGLPGLVVALMGGGEVHLAEKSPKKCLFLRTVIQETQASAQVHEGRIEELKLPPIDVITSRACAPLPKLLTLAQPFFGPNTIAVLHKGQNVEEELTAATKSWKMQVEIFPSATDPRGRLLRVKGVRRA